MRTTEKQPHAIPKTSTSGFLESKYWSVNDSSSVRDLEISIELVSNRLRTHALLKEVGIPVPESRAVYFLEDLATAVCQVGGYPIAIEPLKTTNKEAATLKIDNFIEAKAACSLVLQKSQSDGVLVEKYYLGSSYRILLLEGRVVRVVRVTANSDRHDEIVLNCTNKIHLENIYLAQKVAAFIGLNILEIETICNAISFPISYSSGVITNVNSYSNFDLSKYFV